MKGFISGIRDKRSEIKGDLINLLANLSFGSSWGRVFTQAAVSCGRPHFAKASRGKHGLLAGISKPMRKIRTCLATMGTLYWVKMKFFKEPIFEPPARLMRFRRGLSFLPKKKNLILLDLGSGPIAELYYLLPKNVIKYIALDPLLRIDYLLGKAKLIKRKINKRFRYRR